MRASNQEIKFVAELGILKTIPDFLTQPLKPGRLRAAFVEVEHYVDMELTKIYSRNKTFFQDNKKAITYYLDEFGKKAKWIGNETHVGSVISFCLAFLETSQYKYPDKLFESLNKIIAYYERAGYINTDDLVNAENFQNVWTTIEDYPDYVN